MPETNFNVHKDENFGGGLWPQLTDDKTSSGSHRTVCVCGCVCLCVCLCVCIIYHSLKTSLFFPKNLCLIQKRGLRGLCSCTWHWIDYNLYTAEQEPYFKPGNHPQYSLTLIFCLHPTLPLLNNCIAN